MREMPHRFLLRPHQRSGFNGPGIGPKAALSTVARGVGCRRPEFLLDYDFRRDPLGAAVAERDVVDDRERPPLQWFSEVFVAVSYGQTVQVEFPVQIEEFDDVVLRERDS